MKFAHRNTSMVEDQVRLQLYLLLGQSFHDWAIYGTIKTILDMLLMRQY